MTQVCSPDGSQLQQSGVNIPTMYTGAWVAAGRNPANTFVQPGRGEFLTIWAYSAGECATPVGHMFVDVAGRGWGTSRANPGGGPGWLTYTGPGPFPCARPYHIPALEAGLDPAFVAGLAPTGRNATGLGLFPGAFGPRLIELDHTAAAPRSPRRRAGRITGSRRRRATHYDAAPDAALSPAREVPGRFAVVCV